MKYELCTVMIHVYFLLLHTGNRFHDVAVEVSNNTVFEQRGFYKGPGANSEVVQILCDHQTVAMIVRLRIIKGTGNSLNISELEIYTM